MEHTDKREDVETERERGMLGLNKKMKIRETTETY